MYTTYKFTSIIEASNSKLTSQITLEDLCIFDIDSVFFPSIFDFRGLTGIADEQHMESFGNIIHNAGRTWIFTDRPYFLRFLYITKQLVSKMKSKPTIFKNSTNFINKCEYKSDSIIFNARKTSEESMNVLLAATNNYKHVYYFAAQDFPWAYKDLAMIDEVEAKHDLTNLTFIDIRRNLK